MSATTTRRRFLGGIAAITVLPSLPLPALANPWSWGLHHADILDAAIDALPDIPETTEEAWVHRIHGGWENSSDVIRFRTTGQLPWENHGSA